MNSTQSMPGSRLPETDGKSTGLPADGEEREDFRILIEELGNAVCEYSHKRPGVAGCLLFAAGFFAGWRLRPW